MIAESTGAKLVAVVLLGLFLLAAAALIADWYVGVAYRHVVVNVSNVDDTARVDVNCRRALSLVAGEGAETVDLGWLRPEDRVYLSDYNERGAAAWGFEVSNGKVVRRYSDGHAGVTGQGADPYGVAMAQLVTAEGDRIGTVGCDPPGLVSSSLQNYQQSPDALQVSRRDEEAPLWDPPRFPFALIEGLAGLLPLPLAAIGWAVAFLVVRRRGWAARHYGAVLTVLGLVLGVLGLIDSDRARALLISLEAIGLLLLPISALALGEPHTGPRWPTSSSTPDPKPNPE